MSYYKPSFSQACQAVGMSRGGRGGYSSRGGSSYRGGSSRGGSSWGGRGNYSSRGGSNHRFQSSYNDRGRYSDRFSGKDDYNRKSYGSRMDSGSRFQENNRDRSSERKRVRTEASSSRHDSSYGGYGSSRYENSYTERRSFSDDRHSGPFSRREDFRSRQAGPSPSSRGSFRGRLSSRGTRGLKLRDRPMRRRLVESSYAVRKRVLNPRSSDYARRLNISRLRSAARKIKKHSSDKEESDEAEEKDTSADKSKDNNHDVSMKEESDSKKSSEEADKKKESEETKEKTEEKSSSRKGHILLVCPHCSHKGSNFREYDNHLGGRRHLVSMRKIALKQKSILSQMRAAQRNTQNELEKSTSSDLTGRTSFCPLCKLNYKQRKAIHQRSDAHKNMKKFLMPYCKICNITFKSPMIYENHCCSIEHLKRKQRIFSASEDSGEEDNLENFTTIDSVRDEDASEGDENKEVSEPVNVGVEQIRKVEAHYCELCKRYLSRRSESEMPKIIARHCKQRIHMQRYVRLQEDRDLEKRAEKLQRKETAEKETKNKHDGEKSITETESANKEEEETRDDKLWADVDKDLGDILAEAESGNKTSDEEDEDAHVNGGERFDRFKLSEKNGDGKLSTEISDINEENGVEKKIKEEDVKK